MSTIFHAIQIISAIGLIICILLQTTKSEGLYGTIGGKTSSAFKTRLSGEELLNRITTILAVSFLAVSFIVAYFFTK